MIVRFNTIFIKQSWIQSHLNIRSDNNVFHFFQKSLKHFLFFRSTDLNFQEKGSRYQLNIPPFDKMAKASPNGEIKQSVLTKPNDHRGSYDV
jgi:hypothetical protein